VNRSIGSGAIAIAGIIGWLGLVWLGISLYSSTPPRAGFDLELLLQAGRDVAAGRSPYDPALIAGTAPVAETLFYSYPPLVAQAMVLFAAIPSPVMLVAWDLAALAGLAVVAAALGRRLAPDLPTRRIVVPTLALAPLCFPFAIGLLFGNLDVFFPLLYGAMLLAVIPRGGSDRARLIGGVGLAVASLTKLHPASLAGWFGIRGVTGDGGARRVLVAAVVGGLVILGFSLAIGGTQPWIDYLAVIRAGSNADLIDPRNAGPAAQVALLIGADDRFARTLQIGVTIAALAITAAAARPGGDPVERLAWAAVASLVILPVTWFHYPSALIPFGLVALLRARDRDRQTRRRVTARVAAALVVGVVAIAALPLLWLAAALVLGAVRVSRPSSDPEVEVGMKTAGVAGG
jgi:hypothetical protein